MKPLRYPGSMAAVTGVHISCQSRAGQRTATRVLLCCVTLLISCLLGGAASGQVPGQNVNMVSGTQWPYGDPFLERQDEPSLAVSTRNPLHLLAGANDYRTVDLNLPEIEPGEPHLTNAPTGEPWVGQYMSIDGGARWQSTLLPGYPQDTSPRGMSSPLHGFTTAADPVIASGTNGMFYYAGIAFNRGTSLGLVFVARFMDLNNKENGNIAQDSFPIRYINTTPVAYGSNLPAQFLDKPWLAVDIPRSGNTCTFTVTQADGTAVRQTIPAGNVYVAYAKVLTGSAGETSTIYFSRSTNCGSSWSPPVPISQGFSLSQGATIQIDPETGIVYVAWRVIHNGTQHPNDGIAITASLDGGHSFLPAISLVSLPPFNFNNPNAPAFFDQNTTATSFRTTAYPALAVADSGIPFFPGPLYLAWSQRGLGPNGEARIMMLAIPGNGSFGSGGFKPPTPFPVDNGAITNDIGGTFPALTAGHQVMPTMTFNQGKLMLLYYDLRQDHSIGEFAPNISNGQFTADAMGNFFEEARDEVADSPAPSYSPYFIDDAGLTVRRHTLDLVLAQSNGSPIPAFSYTRVSHYDFGLFEGESGGETAPFHQLKFDPPNLPMFMQGTGAFMGDYLGLSGQPFVLVKCGNSQCWTYNNPSPPGVAGKFYAAPKPAPSSAVHFATWTSNQDVIPPADGQWDAYTAIATGTSVYDNTKTVPTCQPGSEGDRNQNVYASRISQGLLVSSPQVSKPLSTSIQRGFVILVENQTSGRASSGFVNYFRLTIANQPQNGFASFAQFVPPSPVPSPPFPSTNNGVAFPFKSIDVAIAPHTGIARTVFAVSSNATASILVNVNEITGLGGTVLSGGLSAFLLLNADGTVPTTLVDPNGQTGSNSITDVEVYNPNVSAPNVSAPNVSAPNVSAPNVSAPNVSAPNVSAPNVSAPNVSAPNVSAYGVANPNVSAPNVSAPNVSAAPPSDGTFSVTNNGNTTASYNLALTGSTPTPLQLLLSQIYMTPQTDGQCHLITQQQNITLANLPNAPFTPVSQLGNPNVSAAPVSDTTFSLGPGGTAYITIRGNVDIPTMQRIVTQVTPVVIPQAINSNNTTATTPPIIFSPLAILTPSLPPTDRLDLGYSVQLTTMGGRPGAKIWTITAGAFPPGISLSPAGLISGQATTPGSYPVTIQVADGNSPPDIASQAYVLDVSVTPLTVQFTFPPNDGIVGQNYTATPLTVTGGTTPYSWTAANLPPGLSINTSTGQITGIPTTPNPTGSSVVVTATDAATPPESISNTSTIRIGAVIQIFPPTLPSGAIGVPYSAQLTATGGIGAPVFGPPILTGGGTLSSNGLITFANPQASSISFTVSVHDQANPAQFVTSGTYTIAFANGVANLSFVTQPTNTLFSQPITPAVQVRALDNTAAVVPNLAITLTLNSGPGTLGGTLTQMTNAAGIATFPNLSVSAVGTGDTLLATAGVVTAPSAAFNVTSAPACAPVPFPPLSWYPMNGNALDIRGGRPGTLVGTGGQFVAAEVGQGFKSGGEGSLIAVHTTPYLTPVNFTVGAWVRVDALTNDATEQIVWQGDSGSNLDFSTTPYSLGVLGNGSTPWVTYNSNATIIGTAGPGKVVATISDGLNELDIFSNTALTPGVFYYVALTWNGPARGASIWINGTLDRTGAGSAKGVATPTNPFQIGGIAGVPGSASFNGVIDELQIFGSALTHSQISAIYNAGSGGECQNIWFTESNGPTNKIGVIAPGGTNPVGEFTPQTAASFPYSISAGEDGNIWFTENTPNNIGELAFVSGGMGNGELPIPDGNQYGAVGITSGPDGNLWFTEGAVPTPSSPSYVGSIAAGTITLYSVPTPNSGPWGITAGPDGNLWFAEIGSGKIARMTTGGSILEFQPSTAGSGPAFITAGPDGNLWFTESSANKIGVMSTIGVTLNEFPVPTPNSGPWGITLGPDGNLWFTENNGNANKIGRITPNGTVTEFQVPGSPEFITTGPDSNLWYTDFTTGEIGRMTPVGTVTEFPVPTSNSGPWGITLGPDTAQAPAPPAPPTNVTGSSPFGEPVISWTASTSSNVVGYNVYRATSPSGPFTFVGTTASTTFTDSNAPGACGGTNYYYLVTTVGVGNAESTFSNETSAINVYGPC